MIVLQALGVLALGIASGILFAFRLFGTPTEFRARRLRRQSDSS